MGARLSHREVVPQNQGARDALYKYPPPDGGNYFSSHFRFGHRKYETGSPEYFLFGDMTDVNFLNKKPVQFPYKQPEKQEPLYCLQALINVHRDSVRLIKSTEHGDKYHVAFEFNSDVDCRVSLLSSLPDSTELAALRHTPGSGVTSSHHYLFPKGSERKFIGKDFPLSPEEMKEEDLAYDPENGHDTFPLAILLETAGGSQYQNQLTLCSLDKSSDRGYTLKVLKQKLWVDGVEYLLHEMYGLENKVKQKDGSNSSGEDEGETEDEEEDEEEDLGAECVVCITAVRDTLLLPCRHLCMCALCATNLRYQSNNCPICRAPFKALLQVTAMKPLNPNLELDEDEVTGNPRYEVSGFEKMPLLEALNGYKLKLPSEVKDDEDDLPAAEEEGVEEGEREAEGGGGRLANGAIAGATMSIHTTDTVISVEEDPEIEALSKEPLATPTSVAHRVKPQQCEHTRIDVELGQDIPGLVVSPTDPEVVYRPYPNGGQTVPSLVTVVVEDGRGEEEEEGEGEVEMGERVSQESETSCGSTSSAGSAKQLIKSS